MTIFYPDISSAQGNISLAGTVAVCSKATEASTYTNPHYAWTKGEASRCGAFFFAYHFLHAGNGAAQADHCFRIVGKTPIMLDWEETRGSEPRVGDAIAFIDRFRALGGIVNLVYLPKWYWQQIGSPSLSSVISRGLKNVASYYTSYSDNGPGWNSFGGLPVAVWQFSSSFSFNGQRVDFNAFKGTVAQLAALVNGKGGGPVSHSTLKVGDTGTEVKAMQARINVWNAAHPALSLDSDFGPTTLAGLREFQKEHGLTIDGVCGPTTWAALLKNPAVDPPIKDPAFHGEYVSAGTLSLNDLASKLGHYPSTLVYWTVQHYAGNWSHDLAMYINGLVSGGITPDALLPKGAKIWVA